MAIGLIIIVVIGVIFFMLRKKLRFCVRATKKGVNTRVAKGMWLLYWCFFALIVLAVMAKLGVIEADYPQAWLYLLIIALIWLAATCYYTDFRALRTLTAYKAMDYFRQTGNDISDVTAEGPIKTEYELYSSLDLIKGYKRIVVNPKIPGADGRLVDIEMVCVCEKVIIVADSLFKDGRWSGEMLDESWGHETRAARFSMQNPILTNQEKVIALNNFLCDKNEGYFEKINKGLYINFTLCGLSSQLAVKGAVPNNCMVFSRQVEGQFYDMFDKMESVYDREFIDRLADMLESRASYDPQQRRKAIERKYKPYKPGKPEPKFYATVLEGQPLKAVIVRCSPSGFAEYDGSIFVPSSARELESRGLGAVVNALRAGGEGVFDDFYDAFAQSTDIMKLVQGSGGAATLENLTPYLEGALDYVPVYYTPEK